MVRLEHVPNRVWIIGGVSLALCSGMAAGAAGVARLTSAPPPADIARADGPLLQIRYAQPTPIVVPPPPAPEARLPVLADPPADLSNLDPDAQSAQGYLALMASERRYQRQLEQEASHLQTIAVPEPAPVESYENSRAYRTADVQEDQVAASGDTSSASASE